jgi:hypothetical protein
VKKAILAVMVLTAFACITLGAERETRRAEETTAHNQHGEDLAAASRVDYFPPADRSKGSAYLRTVIEADLLSLHVCQGSRQLFTSEHRSDRATASTKEDALADAQGAAECVVELQSALREVPSAHPAYADIRTELAWWSKQLLEVDPADYRRLNP